MVQRFQHEDEQEDGNHMMANGEMSLLGMKKYIAYCRAKCAPRLSSEGMSLVDLFSALNLHSESKYTYVSHSFCPHTS